MPTISGKKKSQMRKGTPGFRKLAETPLDFSRERLLNAIGAGCTDRELAGLLGIKPIEFAELVDSAPELRQLLDYWRAQNAADLRVSAKTAALNGESRVLLKLLEGLDRGQEETTGAASWLDTLRSVHDDEVTNQEDSEIADD